MSNSDRLFDDKVAGAFARNGLNTILLDIKEELSGVGTSVRHIQDEQQDAKHSRRTIHEKLDSLGRDVHGLKQIVNDIAPKVLVLDTERTQRIGVRGFFKRHYLIGAALAGAVAAGWHQWDRLVTILSKVFK